MAVLRIKSIEVIQCDYLHLGEVYNIRVRTSHECNVNYGVLEFEILRVQEFFLHTNGGKSYSHAFYYPRINGQSTSGIWDSDKHQLILRTIEYLRSITTSRKASRNDKVRKT